MGSCVVWAESKWKRFPPLMTVKGKPKPHGHWTDKVLRITPQCPLAGLKADTVANQGAVRETAVLGSGVVHVCFHPKDPNDATKGVCGWTWSTAVKPTKAQKRKLGINVNLAARHGLIHTK
jgi:hypothetical protein